ncbi:hypothetical protein [Absidia glauca]|uniref:Ndc10 domain-containing protein n=1 Tax=Absidia glauca TaxID=4829 RepID=A0A168QAR1_ABSGL|nr:hypothetical protein [Absidia glauca]
MKIKPPRKAQEWSFSSHREPIGKALSSPGIISGPTKRHISCGSSARMAGNVCVNVDQIRRQGRWNNTAINGAYFTNLSRELVRSMAGFPTFGRFFYLARAALDPPTSLCKKLCPAIGQWHDRLAAKELSPGDHIQLTVAENAFVQNSTPAIPFDTIQSSLIQPICHSKGIYSKLKLRNTILPTYSSNNVCLYAL